ncbi:MATE family efflux transporter, partial [Kaistella sp.]|uniref:MATE family efflux transporter n=1 Tax=Kaistella sp. TaxID=2782235 RepID=UPI002F947B6F
MSSTKNIAKNSLFLYLRMFINMGVGLFTAGIVLNTLGISDYGIYNIVGGFVSMFGFLSTSMSTATQRFMSFDIGKKDFIQLRKTFSTTVSIHFVIGVIIVLILETFGLWYINNKLNVSDERIYAANIVFQFSVLTSFFSILQVPYNALITAHEKFKIYAYIGFLDTAFKLIILYFLKSVSYDKLILYSFLLFLSSFIIRMIYRIYCRRNFPESHYFLYFDRAYFKTLLSFTGWNLIGNIADVARGQGNNLLLNIFFGTVMNAAYGITLQVQNLVKIFITNF